MQVLLSILEIFEFGKNLVLKPVRRTGSKG